MKSNIGTQPLGKIVLGRPVKKRLRLRRVKR